MRKSKLVLFLASILAAVPLAITSPASADPPPCLRTISIDSPRVWEGTPGRTNDPTPLVFHVTTTGCLARAAAVEAHTIGQYKNNGDFVGVNTTLAWPAGNGDAKTITVSVNKDAIVEHDEGVHIGFCYDSSLVKLSTPLGPGIILNDDPGSPAPESPVGGEQVCK